MAHVWNILNTLRIINLMPGFVNMEYTMPLNVRSILKPMKFITDLKVIDGEAIYDWILD